MAGKDLGDWEIVESGGSSPSPSPSPAAIPANSDWEIVDETAAPAPISVAPRSPGMLESFAVGAAQGAAPLGSGAFLDEAVGLISNQGKEYLRSAERDNPLTFTLGNLAGGIATPDPIAKLKAVRNAGVLAKVGYASLANLAEGYLTSLGSGDGDLRDRTSQASDSMVTDGLWSLATAPLRALGFKQPAAEKAAKAASKIGTIGKDEAKAAYKLGQELTGPLSKPAAQIELSQNIRGFQPLVNDSLKLGRESLGQKLDEVSTSLSNKEINIRKPIMDTADKLQSFKPEELTPQMARGKRALDTVLRTAQESFANNSIYGKADVTNFASVLDQKRKLGKMIWEEKIFKDPDMKSAAQDLYFGLSKALEGADETGEFAKINKSFDGSYRLQEVADDLDQTKITSLSDPQSKNYELIDKAKVIFNDIPSEYRFGSLGEVDKVFNESLPELVVKSRVMRQITGRLPGEQNEVLNMVGGRLSSLNNFIEGNRLQFINRLSSEDAGKAKPILNTAAKVGNRAAKASNVTLSNLTDQE